jgi:acetylornithine/succinyldiaminopimelate/putrescine aminotransferase/predicted amino acid dehydrogenase
MKDLDAYGRLVRPSVQELLQTLHLDVAFERGEGCHLWPAGAEAPVLDLVGGYGTLLFGHNHPALVEAAIAYLKEARPVHAQASIKPLCGRLARRLAAQEGDQVLFASSGSEAVEAALRHVLQARPGPIVALEGAFHGKTLGALQLTGSAVHRVGLDLDLGLEVVHVPPNDRDALAAAFERHRPAALFLELVQGEGGVVPLEAEYVRLARELCTDAALVVDECQTGLGRTGRLLACEHYGLDPDLLVLSKALGGGLAKISALRIRRERVQDGFDLAQISTFADDDFSAAVALRVLDLLTPEALARCAETGRWLRERLDALALAYPEVIREVRGLGLMLGIELLAPKRGFLFSLMGRDLGAVVAGYLYHEHRVRIAPTLSNPLTLRVQPPLVTPRAELQRFVDGLDDACRKLQRGDSLGLTRYFLPATPPPSRSLREGWTSLQTLRPAAAPRAAWLFHLLDANDLLSEEPGFAALSFDERDAYLRHLEARVQPVVMSSFDVRSRLGRSVRFDAILLPVTTARIREQMDRRDTRWLGRLVESGVAAARELGCGVVSLGQYTSILTRNGRSVSAGPIGVTTGNAYAVALALEALERAVPDLGRCTVAVVGATGNIGAIAAELLAQRCRRMILVGREAPGSLARLARLPIPGARITADLAECRQADVVVVSVSSATPVVHGEHLKPGAWVCDVSVPTGVAPGAVADERLICGGIARLPHDEPHGIPGLPLEPGRAFACMAEGMILALEGIHDRFFTGALSAEHVRRISRLAARHGFSLAEAKTDSFWESAHVPA